MDDDQWKTLGADVCLYTKQILIASKDQQTPNPLAPLIVIPLIVTTVVGFDLDRTVVGGGGYRMRHKCLDLCTCSRERLLKVVGSRTTWSNSRLHLYYEKIIMD